ncbi:MAG: DUF6504 family protein [Bacillota bacterium]
MGRILDRPLAVQEKEGIPASFRWNGRRYPVEKIIDAWKDTGCWWENEGSKIFYRVMAQKGVFEIYRDLKKNAWFLYKIYD